MESKEFRIGNLMNENYQILEIHRDGCLVVDANNPDDSASEIFIDFENIKPIPLTEEWLLKFGFNSLGNWCAWYNSLLSKVMIMISVKHQRSQLVLLNNEIDIPNIKYVHQLQNLYFALTGEELTIKR